MDKIMKKMNYKSRILGQTVLLVVIWIILFAFFMENRPEKSMQGVAVLFVLALLLAIILWNSLEKARGLRELESILCQEEPEVEKVESSGKKSAFLCMNEQEIKRWIFEHMEEISDSNSLKIEAELHALQNQINPHFLYNTLEVIRGRALLYDNTEVADMVVALAKLFRYCINSPGELATLAQELDNIKNYFLIQRYRFGERFSYFEEISGEYDRIMECRLPVLTLQPIMENALLHGIIPKLEGGSITCRIEVIDKRLQIQVEDDGVGIMEETLREMRRELHRGEAYQAESGFHSRGNGIALGNVNKRIRFYFGEGYGVDVASTWQVGTVVTVTVPLIT